MKNTFGEWFAKQVEKLLKLGPKVEETDIQFRLNTMKPLHQHWLLAFYNQITSASGSSITINGWNATGAFYVIKMDSAE